MRTLFTFAVLACAAIAAPAFADAQVGKPAPSISAKDWNGKPFQLNELKGKTVVLEWHNPNCPFVRKHYNSANMPGLQAKYAKQVVWVAINSTSTGHQDFMTEAQLKTYMADKKSQPAHYVMDKDGLVGRAYGAKTTPQMVVINAAGTVVYNGAIDSIRSADAADIPKSKNYLSMALDDMAAGKPVSTATSTPYGCSVKYN
jgi:peroxiredoxin